MKKIFLFIIVLILGVCIWVVWALRPVNIFSDNRITVRIPSGSSVLTIADILEDKGVIRSDSAFMLYIKLFNPDVVLQAGSFVLQPSMTVKEIISALESGFAAEEIITIPEGFTLKDIDALLTTKGLTDTGALMRCARNCDFASFEFLPFGSAQDLADRGGLLEGYLFPDTYFVVRDDFVGKFFLERMMTLFRKKVLGEFESKISASSRSLHEVITMASLIEEETRTEDERPIVSGILWKRYDAGRGLEVDAAVRYILDKPTDVITAADLNVNNPYNIRKFRGLPPGPIANPSISSIRAALNPKESEYWYYLHGKDGKIRYATTNEEHNINRYRYLK